jgi:ABC-type polysaccharide/polyol phosphate export permease
VDRRYRHLIVQLALKDFKIRYTHSALGYAWTVINPLLFAVIYYLVFSIFMRVEMPFYPAYLLLGIVLWNFFSEGSSSGLNALFARAGLVTKVPMPREVVVYAAVLHAFMSFAISLVVVAVLLWLTGAKITWPAVTFPIALIDLVLITLGVALLLAPLQVRYHDIGYLWGIAVQVGFWLTPIIYHDTFVPERWRWLVTYNPLARIITQARESLVFGTWTSTSVLLETSAFAVVVLVVGWVSFRRQQLRLIEHF